MTTSPSLPFLLLLASADYTALAARHTCDEDGFGFFLVAVDGIPVAEVALWRDADGLETCDGWCEFSAEALEALHADDALGLDGVLDRDELTDAIYTACLEADDEARTITAELGDDIHEDEIMVEVLLGGQRVGSVQATRCRDHRHPEGGLAVSEEDAASICREHASLSVEALERAASDAFRSAWADPQHPTRAWALRTAVEAYAGLIGTDISDDDIRELGFAGALAAHHGYSNAMREQQPWTVIYSAAQVAAMAEWHAAL
jgi:hypothetical protein